MKVTVEINDYSKPAQPKKMGFRFVLSLTSSNFAGLFEK